jgi:glyoxylase-like metal-dependent hydrolase (beta-lactamase superfamily II)
MLIYAETLSKPITRLYITHYHPDHLLGAGAFSVPIYALSEVKAKIAQVGDRIAAEEREKLGAVIPLHAEQLNYSVLPGPETIDGIPIEFIHLRDAETEDAMMIGFPEHGILISQDMIYNRVHAFCAERAFDAWSESLRRYQKLSYSKFLPGHGDPGEAGLCDEMLHYLSVARDALAVASDPADLKRRINSSRREFFVANFSLSAAQCDKIKFMSLAIPAPSAPKCHHDVRSRHHAPRPSQDIVSAFG